MAKTKLQLGRAVAIPASPDKAVLDRVPNPQADTEFVARFTFPEFTSICPVTGQPDFGILVIDYVPDKWLVESKSLKLYLQSFRNHGAFHEDCTVAIGRRVADLLKPQWLRIGGYFNPRGGMPIDVFWQTGNTAGGRLGRRPGRRPLSRPRLAMAARRLRDVDSRWASTPAIAVAATIVLYLAYYLVVVSSPLDRCPGTPSPASSPSAWRASSSSAAARPSPPGCSAVRPCRPRPAARHPALDLALGRRRVGGNRHPAASPPRTSRRISTSIRRCGCRLGARSGGGQHRLLRPLHVRL